jgi:membrane fusion protein (multidrug efflux system)
VPVKVVRVAEEAGGSLSGLGSVRCRQTLELSFEATGLISQVLVDEGDLVQKGQVLARLDDKVLTSELKAKQAEAESAAFEVERLKAKKEEKEKLFQGRAVTASEVREVGFELDKALAKARGTQAEVASLAARERNLVLKAPVAGTVVKRLSEPGEVVTPNSTRKVLKLADCRQVLCEVELGERLYTQVKAEQEVVLLADALPGRRFKGKVHAVGVEIDEKNRTFVVKVAVENQDLALKPGMFVRASVLAGGQAVSLWLPPQALKDELGDQAEVTVIQDRRATPRKVRLGRREPGRVQVLDGVSAGELVLVPGDNEAPADKRP